MRTVGILIAALAGLATFTPPALLADGAAVLVVPGRPGVPVMYFGRDISWAVVEGDMGLDRPGSEVTILPGRPPAYWGAPASGYFPSTGRPPPSGRLEIEPPANRVLPPPAESFHQQWGAESAHTPVTVPAPYDAPPVIIGPQVAPDPRRPPMPPRPPRPAPHTP
jgi:hypothetical protein